MKIQNQTSVPILCALDDGPAIQIEPGCQGVILTESREGTLRVEHLYSSRVGKLFKNRKMRIIVLSSWVSLSELCDDTLCYITGEVVQFSCDYSYDRFYCRCQGGKVQRQKLQPTQTPEFLKEANREDYPLWIYLLDFFIDGYFAFSTCAFFLAKLYCWSNALAFSWWWLPGFWGIAFLSVPLLERLEDVVGGWFLGLFGVKEDLSYSLEEALSEEAIAGYFDNSKRKWKNRKAL